MCTRPVCPKAANDCWNAPTTAALVRVCHDSTHLQLGCLALQDFIARLKGRQRLQLLRQDLLAAHRSTAGPLFIMGCKGRRALGGCPAKL